MEKKLLDVIKQTNKRGSQTISISKTDLLNALTFFRNNNFLLLIDLFAVDYPENEQRYEVIYVLLSINLNKRIILKVKTDEVLPSAVKVFRSALWFEREAFDMYGVKFSNNPDLRRILTDYNFEGHPMLKDFPLTGYKEVKYDLESGEIVYDNVKLTQDYRSFDFLSPWEGLNKKI